ncbi:PREDICTED: uncharacterized protein LOC109174828 [Ipomoea nil]|uniref:uncharacterized protein LOC109174828 n=1 Tax=Ipomoea nil TaxID=35883 RepID=UPI000900D270|nr:PREDICTED: uncharacterized protein LOC109174828 [Ipomoea nil]
MVSEPWRTTYAAVVTGDGGNNQGASAASPVDRSPDQVLPGAIPQRNHVQSERNYNIHELENPLFFSSTDSASAILVSPALNGSSNYGSWSVSMKIALEVKNKWTIVNGSTLPPSREQSQYAAWRRCNLMICSWIFKSVLPSIAQSVMHFDDAKSVWDDLKRRFSQQDAQRISILQSETYNLRQGSMSVNEYYTRCRTLWEEMNTLRPIPICKCDPRCRCDLTSIIRKERDTDQVIRFLQGLNDEYNNLKSSVLILNPLPEVYKIFVMAEKLERQISLNNLTLVGVDVAQSNAVQGLTNDETVAAVPYLSNGRRNNVQKAKCTYCGMSGHTIDKCYKKQGYPPGWVPGYKSKAKQQSTTAMSSTNDLGFSFKQMQKMLSYLQTQVGQSGPSNSSMSAACSLSPKFDESHDSEGKYLVNSLSLNNSTWILDSGATNHIVSSLDFLDNHCKANGVEVHLPTGQCVSVEHIGEVKFNDNLLLKGVLYIPLFKFNIISVSKLINDAAYKLTFMSKQCLIQESLRRTVGLAKEEGGLYVM